MVSLVMTNLFFCYRCSSFLEEIHFSKTDYLIMGQRVSFEDSFFHVYDFFTNLFWQNISIT